MDAPAAADATDAVVSVAVVALNFACIAANRAAIEFGAGAGAGAGAVAVAVASSADEGLAALPPPALCGDRDRERDRDRARVRFGDRLRERRC